MPLEPEQLAQALRKREEAYWRKMFEAMWRVGFGRLPGFIELVRYVKILICTDGVLTLRFPSRDPFKIDVIDTRPSTMVRNLRTMKPRTPFGDPLPVDSDFEPQVVSGGIEILAPFIATPPWHGKPGAVYVVEWLSAVVHSLNTKIEDIAADVTPRVNEDLQTFLFAHNLAASPEPSTANTQIQLVPRLRSLASDYDHRLSTATSEADMQRYFESQPFVLGRDGALFPQVPLGKEYRADFVVTNPLDVEHSHTFIEIESPEHRLFRKDSNQFLAPVTHAVTQVRDWKNWLARHHEYFKADHPTYQAGKYVVVIGRRGDLDPSQIEYLSAWNVDNNDVSIKTYDDLGLSLRALIDQLEAVGGEGNEPG